MFGSVGSGKVGSGKVGSGNVGSGNVGSGKVGSGKVDSGNVGSGNVGSGKVVEFHRNSLVNYKNHFHLQSKLIPPNVSLFEQNQKLIS